MLPTKFRFLWPNVIREDLKKSANQKQELSVAAMFVNGSGQNEHATKACNIYFVVDFTYI
jgi:hypothetical protein